MSIRDAWKTPEWVARRDALVAEVGCCDWCGVKPGETYRDSKGVERRVALAPHHRVKPVLGLKLYRLVSAELFKDFKKTPEYHGFRDSVTATLPSGYVGRDAEKRVYFQWCETNRDAIKARFDAEAKRVLDDYVSLSRDKVIVLCGRCHYAREKGLVICFVCRKNFHEPRYMMCRGCRENGGKVKLGWAKTGENGYHT